VGQYQKGKNNLDFTEARDSEWQWHQLGHMQVCTSLQTDNHASTSPLNNNNNNTHRNNGCFLLLPGLLFSLETVKTNFTGQMTF